MARQIGEWRKSVPLVTEKPGAVTDGTAAIELELLVRAAKLNAYNPARGELVDKEAALTT